MLRIGSNWIAVSVLATVALVAPICTLPAAQPACTPTRPDSEGPFYKANAPERAMTGRGLVVSGTVRSGAGCGPLAGAVIEWWSANPRGEYDDGHRATQRSDSEGRYRYETDLPGRYPGRPPHLHIRVSAAGYRPVITQIYPKPGQAVLHFDFVLARD